MIETVKDKTVSPLIQAALKAPPKIPDPYAYSLLLRQSQIYHNFGITDR